MTGWDHFEDKKQRLPECELCESMCPDAVDGTLTEAERRVFDQHVAGCPSCAKELEEAHRGAAWLGMLKGHTPEPPAALLAKILAETTGVETPPVRDNAAYGWDTQDAGDPEWGIQGEGEQGTASLPPVAAPVRQPAPAWALSSVMRRVVEAFRVENTRTTFQPRLAMTAAMAFVSIALTLNLTGVRLDKLRASSFTPSAIRRTVADTGASVARSFENMRVVYQVESRVSELRGQGPLAAQPTETPFVEQEPTGSTNSMAQPEERRQTAHKKGL